MSRASNPAIIGACLVALACIVVLSLLMTTGQAGEAQEVIEIGYLQRLYDFVRAYRTEVVVTWCLVGNPMLTFFVTQKAKRLSPAILKRRLGTWEIQALTYPIIGALTWVSWWTFADDMAGKYFVFVGLISAIMLDRTVSGVMSWAKRNRPCVYEWLRNDRRGADRTEAGSPVGQDQTQYFDATTFREDDTEPK